ncbi:TIGR02234 family membrane protein [Corynebacterium lizhenjunii]|uniref:TIGR02234 family membrane protein n=1 Tax=Corynebacterium lizhenjunii TaxID=2709394 RepID=A0A7T0P9Z8_9CORY|nr:TIGR02234 family membrane protein [Corynebacterium lizhenjunii]QPK78466.1 TIGR02234 family membrane protein [Corynebacterium lizhenjunii]
MGRKYGPACMTLAALGLWAASRMTWVHATVDDDKSGTATYDLTGSTWALESTAVALLLLAGALAGLALRRGARRGIGVAVALAAAGVAWRPVALLTYGADLDRTQQLLHSAGDNTTAVGAESISSWAQVTAADATVTGPALAIAAAAVALFGAMLLAMRPGQDSARSTRYETKAVRADKLQQELRESPNSGRVLWDALDEDIDPTDPRA